MKIAIDTRWIFPEISGIGAYTLELLREFRDLDLENEYLLVFNNADVMARTMKETGLDKATNFKAQLINCGVFSPASQLLIPRLLTREGCDVFHSPNYMIPLFWPSRTSRPKIVTTIHDVIPLVFKNHAPRSKKSRLFAVFVWVMRRVGRISDSILTVSEASRLDVLKHLEIPENSTGKVKAIYNGVSADFCPEENLSTPSQGGSRERKLLYVGRADPYKNLCVLVKVLAVLRNQCPFPVTLTVAGSRDDRYPEAEDLAKELDLTDAMTWTGYLTREELIQAYRTADVLVHPSRYEGFGLQVLEAMSCGLPVVCSDGGSLPEVAGDAALVVSPDDVDGYVRCVGKVLKDSGTRAKLVEAGFKQAGGFTWRRSAEATLEVYRKLWTGLGKPLPLPSKT
jgi:glycosyltransferase involved in cell wall biosynthesis